MKIYRLINSNEYEYSYKGNYGAAGEKRAPRKKATPEQVKRQNQINRINKVRRLIKANFVKRDYWCTLKYRKGERFKPEKIKKDFQKFLRKVRERYKKLNQIFKFIYRIEIGANGGIHIHILINRIAGAATDLIIRECWTSCGGFSVNYQLLYEAGGYADLAEYIVKEPNEEQMQQLSFFENDEQKKLISYNHSRNLIIPQCEKHIYTRRTVRKIIAEGPKPQKGYYVDKSSIRSGVNRYTGMSYLHYTENIIEGNGPPEGEDLCVT